MHMLFLALAVVGVLAGLTLARSLRPRCPNAELLVRAHRGSPGRRARNKTGRDVLDAGAEPAP